MSGLTQTEANEFSVAWGGPTTVEVLVLFTSYNMLVTAVKHAGCTIPSSFPDELKNAQAFFLLELLQQQGQILRTPGDLRKQVQGRVTTEVQDDRPFFFFGGQDSSLRGENIASLLPHMTYWQLGSWMIYNWCEGDIGIDDTITFTSDVTTRGAYWNVPDQDITP